MRYVPDMIWDTAPGQTAQARARDLKNRFLEKIDARTTPGRPEKHNAMSVLLMTEITAAFKEIEP